MENFEAFRRVISLSINFLFLKSVSVPHSLVLYSFIFIFTGLSSGSCLLIANMLRYEHRISRHFNATITRKLFRIFYHIGSGVMAREHRQFSHTLDMYSQRIPTTKIRASKGKKNNFYSTEISMRKVDLSSDMHGPNGQNVTIW